MSAQKDTSFTPIPDEIEPRLYDRGSYNNKARWISYYYQYRIVYEYKFTSVLDVGAGNAIATRAIKEMIGVEDVKTADINHYLNPDYVASVEHLPVPDKSFDAVTAYEILEHLPFEKFISNLQELQRVAKRYVVIGLPDQRKTLFALQVKLPFMRWREITIRIPRFSSIPDSTHHHFEIGLKGYPLKKIINAIDESGLTLVKHFTTLDGPTSHYFIMKV
jgi:ubiquinone/menaquinone biosynthesis C-methylase UbiE